jgi:hypothetical protein
LPRITITPRIAYTENHKYRLEYELSSPETFGAKTLFYEVAGRGCTPPRTADGAVAAILMHAMQAHCDVHVQGAVSEDCIANLTEFQLAWESWMPHKYQAVVLTADAVERATTMPQGGIIAFSGGVDSSFSVLRHSGSHAWARPLSSAVVIQGFDVGLDNQDGFADALDRTRPVLDERGLETYTVRTNSKALEHQRWEESCGAELAACLQLFSSTHRYGMVGSTEPYNAMVIPWGSTPVTDHLLSSSTLQIIHDGARFSRMEKLVEVAKDATAMRNLRVCWEGPRQGQNCGSCEKCVRTRLGFMAIGLDRPPCFETGWNPSTVRSLPLRNDVQLGELRSILAFVERRGIDAAWVHDLRACIQRGVSGSRQEALKARLDRFGVLGSAQRAKRLLAGLRSGGPVHSRFLR